ncbi:hypothetical protein KKC13_09690 [bacterium]|nr:hypothetical protein [bacterium]MBU1957560.1 hypothetical protein [bacterium]
MKKTLLLVITLLFTTACTTDPTPNSIMELASDTKEMKGLKRALNEYTEATLNNDVPKLINFVYPKVFTVVPKEKMTEVLTAAYATGRVPKVKTVKHIHIEPTEKYDMGIFSIITSSMTTELKSPRPDNADFEAYMLQMLQNELADKGNVNFDQENHIFTINHTDKTLALNENEGWKFAGINQAKKYAEKGILPQAIVNKLQ